jgi:hypothetical protein
MNRRQALSLLSLAGLVVFAPLSAAAQPSTITVPLHLPAAIAPSQPSVDLGKLAAALVESSNFNSYQRPELVGSIPEVHDRYRQAAAGTNLVVSYAEPVQFETVGGTLWVLEIVIGLGSPERVDALFTIDNAGRVVAHEKYSGTLAVELRQAAAAAVGAP